MDDPERSLRYADASTAFNMTTKTANCYVFATLISHQCSADFGPCFELSQGTFCHDTTYDPRILSDIKVLKRIFFVQGGWASADRQKARKLDEKLTGDAE